MKNFFKKLALVLALALVVTVVAPAAASKSEAASVALNATKKTIGVGSSYDFNIKNKVKGSTYKWTSDNTKVAAVNAKNGVVTAKAAGTAKVSVKITLPNKTTKTLTATVTVKKYVDATAVAISNPTKEIKLGASYDFNRTMTPATANNKTYWVVKDAAGKEVANTKTGVGADIMTSAGVFKPAAAGEYTITAECWRSKTATVKRAESEALKVKVVTDFSVKQKAYNSFTVDFAEDMSKTVTSANFRVENAATHAIQAVKDVKFSKDGKTATVITFVEFTDGATYNVEYTNGTEKASDSFVASVGAVDHISIDTQTVVFSDPTEIKYTLYDAKGIDVTGKYGVGTVTMEAKTTAGYLSTDNKLTLFAEGNTAEVTVTYHTYKYDGAGKEIVITQTGVVTAVKASTVVLTGIAKYTVDVDAAGKPASQEAWEKLVANTTISAGKSGRIYAYAETNSTKDEEKIFEGFIYESSDNSVLTVNSDGTLYAAKEGTAYVIITAPDYKGVKYQYTVPVTVTAEAKAASVVLSPSNVTVSNSAAVSTTVKVAVKDQYGKDVTGIAAATVTSLNRPTDVAELTATGIVTAEAGKLTIDASGAVKGTYTYKITVTAADGKELSAILSVNVVETPGNTVYQLEIGGQNVTSKTVDTTILASTTAKELEALASITVKVAEYKNGILVNYNNADITVKDKDKKPVAVSIFKDGEFTPITVDGTSITKNAAAGTYSIEAVIGTVKLTGAIIVTDNQAPATYKQVKTTSNKTSVAAIAEECIAATDGTALVMQNVIATTAEGKVSDAKAGDKVSFVSADIQTKVGKYTVFAKTPFANVTVTIGSADAVNTAAAFANMVKAAKAAEQNEAIEKVTVGEKEASIILANGTAIDSVSGTGLLAALKANVTSLKVGDQAFDLSNLGALKTALLSASTDGKIELTDVTLKNVSGQTAAATVISTYTINISVAQ